MTTDLKPVPELTELNRPYFRAAAEGRLCIQRCRPCGHRWFPPSSRCPACLSTDVEWADVSGRGTLWSWILMHQRYFAGFADEIPYPIGFVQLEEGPFLVAGLVGVDVEDLVCDLPVRVVFEESRDGIVLAKFTPAGSVAATS